MFAKRKVQFGIGALVVAAGFLANALVAAPAAREKETKTTKTAAKETVKAAPKIVSTGTQPKAGQQVASFAGGCFWSLDAMFKQLKGVSSAEPGYGGGKTANPTYEQVGAGKTGHAETINIIFDPKVISYRELLDVLFTVHDPTTLNRQGADEGTQYRSAIWARDVAQKEIAQAAIKDWNAAKTWKNPIVTEVTDFSNFYRAEDYHLDYYNQNPKEQYNKYVIAPKIEKFHAKFKAKLKA